MPRFSKGLILHGIRTYNGTEEAELHIFGSQDKQKYVSVTSHLGEWWQNERAEVELQLFGSHGRAEVRKRNFTCLAIKAECYRGSRTLDLWQSRQSRSAEAELHIFGSPGRDEMWKWIFTSLEVLVEQVRKWNLRSSEVNAEQKCGSGTLDL